MQKVQVFINRISKSPSMDSFIILWSKIIDTYTLFLTKTNVSTLNFSWHRIFWTEIVCKSQSLRIPFSLLLNQYLWRRKMSYCFKNLEEIVNHEVIVWLKADVYISIILVLWIEVPQIANDAPVFVFDALVLWIKFLFKFNLQWNWADLFNSI